MIKAFSVACPFWNVCICIRACAHICVCFSIFVFGNTCLRVYVYIHYIFAREHVHTYIHTSIYIYGSVYMYRSVAWRYSMKNEIVDALPSNTPIRIHLTNLSNSQKKGLTTTMTFTIVSVVCNVFYTPSKLITSSVLVASKRKTFVFPNIYFIL